MGFRVCTVGTFTCFVFATTAAVQALAGQLTYTPVNPSFGGSPLNGSYELGIASANNRHTSPPTANVPGVNGTTSSIQQFQQEITSALLAQIASQIGNQILGANAAQQGTFNVNGLLIQFARSGGQTNIAITDPTNGAVTNISIPTPSVQF